ncbi:hypothetical protein FRACA_4110002 [Frankia canadensis]|uniref:Uncharacterized protein n=1 Tax=Frankia canadensis TaxID=1836972 RepID=A0A2I2KX05_9ACTN|nr:hypothetical protein FRACA_4110002 [Frankia canadensis]SOU57466.1 hypothetical protein FRACA_4110002 [Frankia canadensis]
MLARLVRQQGWTVEEFRRRYAATAHALNARAATVPGRTTEMSCITRVTTDLFDCVIRRRG